MNRDLYKLIMLGFPWMGWMITKYHKPHKPWIQYESHVTWPWHIAGEARILSHCIHQHCVARAALVQDAWYGVGWYSNGNVHLPLLVALDATWWNRLDDLRTYMMLRYKDGLGIVSKCLPAAFESCSVCDSRNTLGGIIYEWYVALPRRICHIAGGSVLHWKIS